MEVSKKLHIIFQAILLLWLIAMSIILHWTNIILFIVVFAVSLIIIGPFVFYIIHDRVKYKEAIPKPAKIIWYINIGLVAVSLIINISLPAVKYENDKYIIDNKEYYTEYAQHTSWYPAKIGLPIGKLDRFSDNFLAALFGLSRVHCTHQDKDNNIMLVSDTMSEFGDFMIYREDFDFPTLEIIEPDKIELSEY